MFLQWIFPLYLSIVYASGMTGVVHILLPSTQGREHQPLAWRGLGAGTVLNALTESQSTLTVQPHCKWVSINDYSEVALLHPISDAVSVNIRPLMVSFALLLFCSFCLLICMDLIICLFEHESPLFYPCFCRFTTVGHKKTLRNDCKSPQRLAVFVFKRSLFFIEIAMDWVTHLLCIPS